MSDLDEEEYIATRKLHGLGMIKSEADKMFEDLGYIEETKYMDKTIVECLYKKDCNGVRFYKDKTFEVINDGFERSVTIPILKAINKKCEELRMDIDKILKEREEKAFKYDCLIKEIKDKITELKSKSGGNVFHIQQTINAEIRLLEELLENKGE